MSQSHTAGLLQSFPMLADAGALFWLVAGCVATSLIAVGLVRLTKLDSFARAFLLRQPSRTEIIAHLEQLAALASAGNQRAARRAGDQSSWRLLRLGADLLAEGAQPPEIAHKLETTAEILASRRVRFLRRASAFSCGLVVFPLGVLAFHLLGVLGAAAPTSGVVAGLSFVFAISLLVVSSTMRLMCERAEDGAAQRTIEVEALIFGLSAISGGASPEEVGSLTRMVLGMSPAKPALRRAA